MLRSLAVVVLILVAGCGRKAQVQATPPVPAGPPEHEVLYREGIAAFRLATPEGYERAAAGAFRRASQLNASNCEYPMRLAESLAFLAQEQRTNLEDFSPMLSETAQVLDARQAEPACAVFEPIAQRVRGLSLYLKEPIRRQEGVSMVNRALELDANDVTSWIVLSRLTTRDARNPLQRAYELAPGLWRKQRRP